MFKEGDRMYKMIERFLSVLTACTVTAVSMTVSTVNAVGRINVPALTADNVSVNLDNFEEEYKAPYVGEEFVVWKYDGDTGDASMIYNPVGGYYKCSWDKTNVAEFLIGADKYIDVSEYKQAYISYNAIIEAESGYAVGALISCYDRETAKLAEIRVLESYSSDIYKAGDDAEKISVNGDDYYVSITEEENVPVEVIYIARVNSISGKEISGKIDIREICYKLGRNDFKLDIDKQAKLYVRGTSEKGKISVWKSAIVNIPYRKSITVKNDGTSTRSVYLDGQYYNCFFDKTDAKKGSMTVSDGRVASCTYNNDSTCSTSLFVRGLWDEHGKTFEKNDKMEVFYDTSIRAEDNYASGVSLFSCDTGIEYCIVQLRNSDSFIDGSRDMAKVKSLGTTEVDGVKYDLYYRYYDYETCYSYPCPQIWCVTQETHDDYYYRAVGSVDLQKHYEAWLKDYIDKEDRITEIFVFAEAFGEGKGDFALVSAEFGISDPDAEYDRVIDNRVDNTSSPIIDGGSIIYGENGGMCTLKNNGDIIGKCLLESEDEVFRFGKRRVFEMEDEEIDLKKGDFINMSYKAYVSTDGNYSIGAEGKMRGEDGVEYIDFYVYDSVNYDAVPKDAEYLGTEQFTNREYDIYVLYTDDVFMPNGKKNVKYYCIAHDKTENSIICSGYMYLADAVITWEKAGLVTGPITTVALNADICGVGGGEIKLVNSSIHVDRNNRYKYTAKDIELLQKFILGEKCNLEEKNYDLNYDGAVDSFDMIELRKIISEEMF